MLPTVTKNPVNIFQSKLNLLILLTYTDIEKAKNYGNRLQIDIEEYLPGHKRDLYFMLGNINLLNEDFSKAKSYFRNCLKQSPKPKLES